MKTLVLFLTIVVNANLVQAQQQISYIKHKNPQTFRSEKDSLYKGHNYDYYNAMFKKATKQRNNGIIITSAGVGLLIGVQVASNNINVKTVGVISVASLVCIGTGTPIWIVGSVKRKKSRKAIEEIKRNLSLSFGTNQHGIGLALIF